MLAPLAAALLALAAAAEGPGQSAAPAKVAAASRPLLVCHGNAVLTTEVYATILDLPAHSKATPALADEVETTLSRFLHAAGYDIATVSAEAVSGQIVVDIDEGRLDRIVYLGESAVGSLMFRLETLLPSNVFNRPLLDRQLAALKAQFGLKSARWQLVVRGQQDEPLPFEALQQLREDALARLREGNLLSMPSGFELRIYVEHYDRGGISPVLGIGGGNGIELGAGYHRPGLFAQGDNFETEARVGLNERQDLDTQRNQIFLSHLGGAARWFSPMLFGDSDLRAYVETGADLISRQRADLNLDTFRFVTMDASLNINKNVLSSFSVTAGAGFERRWLSALRPGTPGDPLLPQVNQTPREQTRFLASISAHLLLPPEELRYDRKHRLDAVATLYGLPGGLPVDEAPVQARIQAEYQRVFYFGYHELWIQARGYFHFGDVPFPDEQQVSDVVRGPFGDLFVRKVAGPRVEFRFALLRDILQFGAYDDAAVYGSIDRVSNNSKVQFVNVFGFAVHALLLDSLQLDANLGTGFTTQGLVETGLSLNLVQAY